MSVNSILACLCGRIGNNHPALRSQSKRSSYKACHLVDKEPALIPPPAYSDTPTHTRQKKAIDEKAAVRIVTILTETDNTGEALRAEMEDTTFMSTTGWSEWLSENIFHALRATLGSKLEGEDMNWAVAFTDAYYAARETAEEQFSSLLEKAKEQPGEVAAEVAIEIILSLIAFGILVRMMKWVVRLLGFSELGPSAGKFLESRLSLA